MFGNSECHCDLDQIIRYFPPPPRPRLPPSSLCVLLADIGALPWVKSVIQQADDMVTFLTNHHYSLALLRKHTAAGSKRELLKPGNWLHINVIRLD